MPRVTFVKSARKDNPQQGIKKGDSYYWWKFRFGGKLYSKTQPKPQQLTQSEFMGAVYDFDDQLAGLVADDSIESQVGSIADDMESLADEQEDKRSNMPDQLQDSEVGSMLEERGEAMREWAEELRGLDFDFEQDKDDFTDEACDELYGCALREAALEALGITEEQVVEEGQAGEVEGPRVPEAVVAEKIAELESEVADRAQEMADEAIAEKIEEILNEAQG